MSNQRHTACERCLGTGRNLIHPQPCVTCQGTGRKQPPVVATISDERIMELAKEHTWFNGSHAMTNYVAFARSVLSEPV